MTAGSKALVLGIWSIFCLTSGLRLGAVSLQRYEEVGLVPGSSEPPHTMIHEVSLPKQADHQADRFSFMNMWNSGGALKRNMWIRLLSPQTLFQVKAAERTVLHCLMTPVGAVLVYYGGFSLSAVGLPYVGIMHVHNAFSEPFSPGENLTGISGLSAFSSFFAPDSSPTLLGGNPYLPTVPMTPDQPASSYSSLQLAGVPTTVPHFVGL